MAPLGSRTSPFNEAVDTWPVAAGGNMSVTEKNAPSETATQVPRRNLKREATMSIGFRLPAVFVYSNLK